jgi:hypothetical protein
MRVLGSHANVASMRIRGQVFGAVAGAFVVVAVTGCGGATESSSECSPADAELVSAVRDTLAAYPEIGATLADGAQQVSISEEYLNGAAEYRALVAGRLVPAGSGSFPPAVGLYAFAFSGDELLFVQPVNTVAVASMPDAVPDGGEPREILQALKSSAAAEAVVACVE